MMHLKGKIRKHKIRLAGLISPFFFFFFNGWNLGNCLLEGCKDA